MNVLNRESFNQTKKLIGLIVSNKMIDNFSKKFRNVVFHRTGIKPITQTESDDKKMIYLNDSIKKEEDFPELLKEFIKANQDIKVIEKEIKLDYSNFTYEQALRSLLPENISIPFSFERIGHIVHLNLKEEQLPYKNIIGQVLLDKTPQVKTVLNKVGEIDTVFRTFKIEIIAGEQNLIAEINENECTFKFNFEEVYWNSRLQQEHRALVDRFKKTDIICDMFAGVGPFALPAAKLKKCKIYANDLNPSSVKYMKENAKNNNVQDNIVISNLDARDFIKSLLFPTDPTQKPVQFTQVIMNLPSTSIEFLDVFRDIFLNPNQSPPIPPPMINCYTFTRLRNEDQNQDDEKEDSSNNKKKDNKKDKNREFERKELIEDTVKNVEEVIKHQIPKDFNCYEVRDVAPKKRMMLISFRMPTILPYVDNSNNNTDKNNSNNTNNNIDNSTDNNNSDNNNNTDNNNNKKRNSTSLDSNNDNNTENKKIKN